MTVAARRALSVAVTVLLARGAVQVTYIAFFCQPHHAFDARASGRSQVVVEQGERVARFGDAIFTCTTDHRLGLLMLHQDLDCYCAPQTMPLAQVSSLVSGPCTLDHARPLLTDDTGSCRFARCNHYVD